MISEYSIRLDDTIPNIQKNLALKKEHVTWLKKTAGMLHLLEQRRADKKLWQKIAVRMEAGLPTIRKNKPTVFASAMLKSARNLTESWMEAEGSHKWIEPEMTSMLLHDAADHLQIGLYLQTGQSTRAMNFAYRLDTASRERIPERVWNFLEKQNRAKYG